MSSTPRDSSGTALCMCTAASAVCGALELNVTHCGEVSVRPGRRDETLVGFHQRPGGRHQFVSTGGGLADAHRHRLSRHDLLQASRRITFPIDHDGLVISENPNLARVGTGVLDEPLHHRRRRILCGCWLKLTRHRALGSFGSPPCWIGAAALALDESTTTATAAATTNNALPNRTLDTIPHWSKSRLYASRVATNRPQSVPADRARRQNLRLYEVGSRVTGTRFTNSAAHG